MAGATELDQAGGAQAPCRRWYSVEAFWREARRQGAPISRGIAYDAVRRRQIPHVRIGKRIMIPADALERLLESSD